ncbi:MAG: M23 family metallopeptidase [Gemmatimonadales bacterium]
MRRILTTIGALGVLLLAGIFAANGSWPWRRLEVVPEPVAPAPQLAVMADTLKPGEAVGALFARHGIGGLDLGAVVELLGLDARRVPAGQVFQFSHADSLSSPIDVTVRTRSDEEVRVARSDSGWVAEKRAIRWDTHQVRFSGRIETSLYDAMTQGEFSEAVPEGDKVRLAWDLADVFAWSVDFTRDIQPDDQFVVLFERQVSEFGESRIGRILASRFEVAGRELSAFRFESPGGKTSFYDAEGTSLRRAFLRAPVEFRRIASGFTRSRKHPILGIWRKHEGIDYSAGSGTPVLASADGSVLRAGWAGSYGRLIELRHRNGITTRYAHLRGFAPGIRPGTRVNQGDVIGYVGSSGLATAAHLHYEFRQNGQARDPNRVDLGSGDPVPAAELSAFELERDRLDSLLAPAPLAVGGAVAVDSR